MPSNALSGETLVRIVEKASTFWERLGDDFAPVGGPEAPETIARRLKRWKQVAVSGDPEAFARRLAWDELDDVAIRRALGPVRLKDSRRLPTWIENLGDLIRAAYLGHDAAGTANEEAPTPFLRADAPVPFEDILAPLVTAATQRLLARVGSHRDLLEDAAFEALQQSLLARLAYVSADCLYLELSLLRRLSTTGLGRLLARASNGPESGLYRQFVDEVTRDGMATLLERYAVLGRLIATLVDQWVEMTSEFLERLAADWPTLYETFGEGADLGRVLALQGKLSDSHDGGRSTLLLTFSTGLKLLYKPRDLGAEVNWFALLAWLNERDAPLHFMRPNVVARHDYGWMEYVVQGPCTSEAEASRYYQRGGMLLCLIYVLGGNDCHFQNVIASGEHPVLIDLETMMHHYPREDAEPATNLRHAISRQTYESVLRTGLLPQWIPHSGGRATDASGLGAVAPQETDFEVQTWHDINTDLMQVKRQRLVTPPGFNVPTLHGAPLSPSDYATEIEDGFRRMYAFLVERREELLAPDGPLSAMRQQRTRFIFRSTRVYYAIAERANHPECLQDGAEQSIELDALSRALLLETKRPRFWPLLEAERQSLEQRDIPSFVGSAGGDSLEIGPGQQLSGCFEEPCYDRLRSRLGQLDGRDLERQTGLIRATLQARVARHEQEIRTEDVPASALAGLEPPRPDTLVAEAIALAEELRARAIGDLETGVAWTTVNYLFATRTFQLEVSGPGLYDGGCGVGLFLAALEQVTGGVGFRDLALAALAPLRSELRGPQAARVAGESGIGGASGLGSFVYGLTRVGQMLGDASVLEDAHAAAALMTTERLAADRTFDVIGGSAGAILGLLALHGATKDNRALEGAVACGRHLLANRTKAPDGHRAWVTMEGKMPAGFAHGAAGIAYALLRLADATGETDFRDAAQQGIAYESGLFSVTEGNWPDLREWTPGSPYSDYVVSWCNGGPGVGLARLGGLRALDTPAIRHDLEAASQLLLDRGVGGPDHLCCGNLGRADILLEMGRQLSRRDLLDAAQARVTYVVQTARERQRYAFWWETQGSVCMPGIFQGISGIGYTLLRVAFPERLPSVLLWG